MSLRDEIARALCRWTDKDVIAAADALMPIVEKVAREAAEQVGAYCIETFEPLVPPAEKLRGVIAEIARRVVGGTEGGE